MPRRYSERLRKLWVPLVAAGLIAPSTTGCSRQTFEFAMNVLTLAVAVTELTANVVAIARADDAHFHHTHCGHGRRFIDGRYVYHAEGQWEFWDDETETWYVYPDGLPSE
jgi:membrane-bound inhibitor of C-type lysozyme